MAVSKSKIIRLHLKRGINAELRRKRLERCCELLRSTDISITDIAPMIGFRSGDYLHSCLKQAFGVTPRKYRLGER
ncbi:MAG: helix-turn-helix domain-containing protein [Verrucomicrobia bacterium]|jgi:transcriptional regulator GlxA family with amidase domain|nr:helix-turn-helix domain-containing protein [Verrucomicrobiota bacterium]MBT7065347.1 helix-turn-helix domain-containing protein [Verrucomicrobiota bacterium]